MMPELYAGAGVWIPVPDPFTMGTLMRMRLQHHLTEIHEVVVRVPKALVFDTVWGLPEFVGKEFYQFSEVGMEREIGKAGPFVFQYAD